PRQVCGAGPLESRPPVGFWSDLTRRRAALAVRHPFSFDKPKLGRDNIEGGDHRLMDGGAKRAIVLATLRGNKATLSISSRSAIGFWFALAWGPVKAWCPWRNSVRISTLLKRPRAGLQASNTSCVSMEAWGPNFSQIRRQEEK